MATEIDNKHSEKIVTQSDEVRPRALEEEKLAAIGADEAAAIPKGTLDPVYEAKARVLNKAVSAPDCRPLPKLC